MTKLVTDTVAPAIVAHSTVSSTVALTLRPTAVVGTYDFGSELHLDEALPGNIGSVVSDLENFFVDPANVLAAQLVKGVASVIGMSESDVKAALSASWTLYALLHNPTLPTDADTFCTSKANPASIPRAATKYPKLSRKLLLTDISSSSDLSFYP